jgi:hypothetical protein
MSVLCRLCSLIPGLGVKLSNDVLARPSVLSAVGVNSPHDGVPYCSQLSCHDQNRLRPPLAQVFESAALVHAEKIALADFDAIMPEQAVSDRGVKIEIRKCEAVEEFLALERDGSIGTGGKRNVAAVRALELSGRERLQVVTRLCQALP